VPLPSVPAQRPQQSKAIRRGFSAAPLHSNATTNQVFKFVSVRPPVSTRPGDIQGELPPISVDRPTLLRRQIAALDGMPDAREKASKLASEFIGSRRYVPKSPEARPFLQRLAAIEAVVQRMPGAAEGVQVAAVVEQEVGESAVRIVTGDGFRAFEDDLWDSLYANVLAPGERPEDRDGLFRALRVVHLLRLVGEPRFVRRSLRLGQLRSETPLIPPDLFPSARPAVRSETGGDWGSGPVERLREARERIQGARDEVERHYRRRRSALLAQRQEVDGSLEQRRVEVRADMPGALQIHAQSSDDRRSLIGPVPLHTPQPGMSEPAPPWRLARRDLSAKTIEVLEQAGLSSDSDDVPLILDRLDREIGRINARFSPLAAKRTVRRVGSSRVYAREPISQAYNVLQPPSGGAPLPVGPESRTGALLPGELETHTGALPPPAGRFQPPSVVQPAPEEPFRVLGIGELLVVRETLLRYEEGDIAHVENVLSGERKTREHRRKRQIEEVVTVETERIEEQERNLESTDRFELQKESERTIETDVSAQAGLSVSASYGTVSVATTANFAYDNARSESNRFASSYARSVTERAASRIQERVREQRTRRSLEEFEETNTHVLDATGRPHLRGVYQWLDKIYSMQIVNYGLRLMLEFTVPEPAAFYIFAQEKAKIPGATEEEPIPPEELSFDGVTGLVSPDVLNAQNFGFYAAAYQAEDIKPPPPELTVISKAFSEGPNESSGEGEDKSGESRRSAIFTKASDELTVPDGYRAATAFVRYYSFSRGIEVEDRRGNLTIEPAPDNAGAIQLGNHRIYGDASALVFIDEDQRIPFSILTNDVAYILNIEVQCEVRTPHFRAWQLETYGAIVSAYKALKSQYDEQAARARVRQGIEIGGRNPQKNRQIEREELKKSCITLLRGKQFGDLVGIAANTSGYASADNIGYPEIVAETVPEQSRTIQFLEQAFEWDQMTYQLYPYFWGRKRNWLDVFPFDDIDPKFADFLRAGAARVMVPVTPAYQDAVLLYIADPERRPFGGGPAPGIDDPLFRSIAAELRRQQGDHFVEREGTVSVRAGSRTVNGLGTDFVEGVTGDTDREIRIRDVVYRIQSVVSPSQLLLTEPYAGTDEEGIPFSIGALLVDQPWTVRVPTSLVLLRKDDELPDFTPNFL
jgi:hypothetical protein